MADEQFAWSSAIRHEGHQKRMKQSATLVLFNPGQKELLKNCNDGNQRIRAVVEDLGLIPEGMMGNEPPSLEWKEDIA